MIFLNINKKNYNIKNKSNGYTKKTTIKSRYTKNNRSTTKSALQKNKYFTPIEALNNAIKRGDLIFLFAHMDGCGPCIATRPEWEKMCNVLREKYKNKYNNVLVVDVDNELLDYVKLNSKPNGFPSMRFISNKGKLIQDYESSIISVHDRSVDSFVEWIVTTTSKNNKQMRGGFVYGEKNNKRKTISQSV